MQITNAIVHDKMLALNKSQRNENILRLFFLMFDVLHFGHPWLIVLLVGSFYILLSIKYWESINYNHGGTNMYQ